MKKLFVAIALIAFFAGCKDKGWSPAERADFISSCSNGATQNIGADKAKAYCTCMQQKLEAKYPDYQDASKAINAPGAMDTPDMKALVQGCLNGGNVNTNPVGNPVGTINLNPTNQVNTWSEADKQKVVKGCVEKMSDDYGDANAQKLCSCMLGKVMQKYKDYEELDRLGNEDVGDQIGKECKQELNLGTTGITGNGGGWTTDDEQKFLNNCVQNAINSGADRQTSNTHCNCVLKKIEKKYSTYNDAYQKMTKEEVSAMEQECVQERNRNNQ